jgi:hypothetical protein
MNRSNLPPAVLSKLLELGEHVEFLDRKITDTERGIITAQARLTGGFSKQAECDDLTASLKQLVADKPVLEKKLHGAQSVLSSCKSWLDRLPPNTVLEQVTTDASGHTLKEVCAKLESAKVELEALRAVPTPAPDVKQRIEDYVHGLGRPTITGIGKGERLKVVWGGSGWNSSGPREDRAEVLPMMALLFPDEITDRLMSEVERTANDPVPIKERAVRIAALTDEIEQLAYVEEALVAAAIADGEDVQRSPNASPQAVLGVKVLVEAKRASRAA